MKVLHVFDYSLPNISGYSLRSDAILRHQRKLGVETVQMTSQRYQQFKQLKETVRGVEYVRTPADTRWFAKLPLLGYFFYIKHLAKHIEQLVIVERPDVIQCHSPMLNALAAVQVARKYNIPIAYEVRALWEDAAVDTGKVKANSVMYRLIKSVEQKAFETVDVVSCICEGLKIDIQSRGIASNKIFITPNAVDLSNFQPLYEKDAELLQRYQLQDKKVIAFIGSFFKYEGLSYLVDAMVPLLRKRKDVHLLLVGGGNERANLLEQIVKLRLAEHVTFVDRVSADQVARYYSLADVMIYPRESIRLTELVTPLKPLEAMAQNKPVIASDIGGHRELIDDGKTGFLVPAQNARALAAKIVEVLDNPEALETVKANGLEYVTKQRTWDVTAAQYVDAYRKLVGVNE
ncbi:glycosyltransferase, exosortase A system-associated [Thalassotalea ponticola]|uniref:TIGR04063 family PEP-CTERM/XrtA system glycosyltransferase n=1 Tax=Thalassotalea ponticola TaxID=1523392 RepID=UPI0025B376A2|nr:TIGR04063 family PEP-CTERM/XrtA system glycosyltransferase [Thalassotalea ponticola]MDN3652428.1 glycosyltransferase, exosortase A system-associated [Thalassotalea ponticola]